MWKQSIQYYDLTVVRPIMEYAADIWDPIHQSNIQQLEKVQCIEARRVLNDFNRYSYDKSPLMAQP